MKPRTDLCATCQKHANSILNSGNFTEEEKEEQLTQYNVHLKKVKCQRDNYRHQIENAKTLFNQITSEEKTSGSLQIPVVYSFDYCQQVHYPHYAQQVGPMFFKTPPKCQCVAVCCESSGKHGH